MKFGPVEVGSWIQGAGDGKEALWTEQLVNLLRQIVVVMAEYEGLQVDQAKRLKKALNPGFANDGTGNFSLSIRNARSTNKFAEILDGTEYLRS